MEDEGRSRCEFTMIVAHRKVNLRQTLDRNVEKYVVKLNRTELKYIRKSSIVNNKESQEYSNASD